MNTRKASSVFSWIPPFFICVYVFLFGVPTFSSLPSKVYYTEQETPVTIVKDGNLEPRFPISGSIEVFFLPRYALFIPSSNWTGSQLSMLYCTEVDGNSTFQATPIHIHQQQIPILHRSVADIHAFIHKLPESQVHKHEPRARTLSSEDAKTLTICRTTITTLLADASWIPGLKHFLRDLTMMFLMW